MTDTTNNEHKLTARFNAFDTTVEVLFVDTKKSISETQRKNHNGFIKLNNTYQNIISTH